MGIISEYIAGEPLQIGSGPHLFLDDALIEDRWTLTRRINPPYRHMGNPIIVADRPWEERTYRPQVFFDSFPSVSSALDILFWDDFEDGNWDDKWINAAQGIYGVIDAKEYNDLYGHFPLNDPNNKGVLVFDDDEGLANVRDHSFVAKGGPVWFGTAQGVTFEAMAQWVEGGQHFVLSVSETDTTGLGRNLAYFEPHVRVILDPAGTVWVQTHWPMDNHVSHVDNLAIPPAGELSKISFYLNEEDYRLYINDELVHEGGHDCDMKEGCMSWSTNGGWGLLDNAIIYAGDYSPKASEIAMSVEPSQKLSSWWGAVRNQH